MSFKPSQFPGGFERHCLRRINHSELFGQRSEAAADSLTAAIEKDNAFSETFTRQFEAVLQRAVALKPSEETEVVLAVKAELDRLYTVASSLRGDQRKTQEALARLIDLTMQSVRQAAGNDAVAIKELQEETQARSLHVKLLQSYLVADLLNSHADTGEFIPQTDLIPTLLCAEKAQLADAVQLFDQGQTAEIIQQSEQLLGQRIKASPEADALKIKAAVENLEFIKGYAVYLEKLALENTA